ncbi:MAG: polyphosphate kinase 1, partial [Ferruginibacter sp.]
VPTRHLPRFITLPEHRGNKYIILLEDVIRYCLPKVFSFFGYDTFSAHVIKVTRDAEIDIDSDVSTSIIQKLEKGIKNRKKGKPVRFLYDSDINIFLLNYLQKRLGLTKHENIIPGGRIHNFKDFMNFPGEVFEHKSERKKPFIHPLLADAASIAEKLMQQDIMLHFPYHTFDTVIDLLREAAIDPRVTHIKLTAYRLAPKSKVIHALTNAVRNGKQVTVVLELRARFDEEANLEWKTQLEEAGVKVLLGIPDMKVHAKICSIRRKEGNSFRYYGFVSTGNLNEKTAKVYGDHCLLTSNNAVMADINRIFLYLQNPKTNINLLKGCKKLLVSPTSMRKALLSYIDREIKTARAKRKASIILKLNSLSDPQLVEKLEDAARAGVEVKLIIRGICCLMTENKKFKTPVQAISIVDEYLEHARVMIFHNQGKEKIFISSADWMVRNIDHRIEAACPVNRAAIAEELKYIINIQLADNVKARVLNNEQNNLYFKNGSKPLRSQVETYNYLHKKVIHKS